MPKGPAELAHGPMLIGYAFNLLLYGILIIQIYLYHTTNRRDPLWIKIFVFIIFLADTLNTIFDFVYLYNCLIKQFGNVDALEKVDWIFATHAPLTSIIACMVQLFYAWRIMVLTKNVYVVIVVIVLAFAGAVAGIVSGVNVIVKVLYFSRFQDIKAVVIVWLGADGICDILITFSLVQYFLNLGIDGACNPTNLNRRKHKTGFKNSDMMIDRIIRLTIQTGLITSVVAILDLVIFLTDPTGTHLILNFSLCKLYSNSLMSSLNARRDRLEVNEGEESAQGHPLNIHEGNWSTKPKPPVLGILNIRRKPRHSTSGVFVHVESHELCEVSSASSYQNLEDIKSKREPVMAVAGSKVELDMGKTENMTLSNVVNPPMAPPLDDHSPIPFPSQQLKE